MFAVGKIGYNFVARITKLDNENEPVYYILKLLHALDRRRFKKTENFQKNIAF